MNAAMWLQQLRRQFVQFCRTRTRSNFRDRRRGNSPRFEPLEDRTLLSFQAIPHADINTLPEDARAPRSVLRANGIDFFVAADQEHGAELWKTDGTTAGTVLVKDVYPGPSGSGPGFLGVVNGQLLFEADDGIHGSELWRSDGTEGGTALVKDIGFGETGLGATRWTVANNTLFLGFDRQISSIQRREELWKSDGTAAGTTLLKTFGTGHPLYYSESLLELAAINQTVFITANDGVNGRELWKSNGTSAGTVLVKDIYPGSSSAFPSGLTVVNDTLFFAARDPDHEGALWKSDGTAAGTVMVKDEAGFGWLTKIGSVLFFAVEGDDSVELWRSNGTAAGTVMVKKIDGVQFEVGGLLEIVDVNGTAFFVLEKLTNNVELWTSDGTSSGTFLVKEFLDTSPELGPQNLVGLNGLAFFVTSGPAGVELWKSDGTTSGTALIEDFRNGRDTDDYPNPVQLAAADGQLSVGIFNRQTGQELWKSNGTTVGTMLVKTILGTTHPSNPQDLTAVGDRFFFTADDGIHGRELWMSDGSSQSAVLVKDLNDGPDGSDFESDTAVPTAVGDSLFFVLDRKQLWRSDGTEVGTLQLHEFECENTFDCPGEFTGVIGTLFFSSQGSL